MQEGGHNIKTSEPENAQIDIIEWLRRPDLEEIREGSQNIKTFETETIQIEII